MPGQTASRALARPPTHACRPYAPSLPHHCLPCSKEHGDFFGIGVSGYPEAHPDVITDDPQQMKAAYWADIAYLKEKVGAVGWVTGWLAWPGLAWPGFRRSAGNTQCRCLSPA